MAGERTLPGLGLYGFWTLGSDGYKDQNDGNIRALSALVQPSVSSVLAAVPVPTNGDIHIASSAWGGGVANDIMVYDAGAWVAITPQNGWSVYDRETEETLRFNGTSWVSETGKIEIITDATGARVLSDTDLSGRAIIEMDLGTAQTLTINSGLVGSQPVTVINSGGGELTFVGGGGVTLRSVGTVLATQHTSVTIIPKGGNTFYLIGALT